MGFKEQLARLFGRSSGSAEPKQLPRQSVEHDSIDKMVFDRLRRQAPSFGQAVTDAPLIPPAIQEPDPLDFTTATPEEIAKWQEDVKAAREAAENMPPYDNFEELARDLFYSYHHRRKPKILEPGEVDPGVAAHPKIIQRIFTTDDHRKSRNITKDDETMSALATRATVRKLKEILSDQLAEQARQSQEFEKARSEANELQQSLDELREQAREQHQQQGHADPELVEQIKQAVKDKRGAQAQAAEIAEASPVPFDRAAHDAVVAAAAAGREAAENGSGLPSFGQGFGQGEPEYESPEQALTIAEMWANNEALRAVADLYGKMSSDFHHRRAKRVVGGQDEIVDLKLGSEPLRRVAASELSLLADDDYEDDFFSRYLNDELLVYRTEGEEHAGRGGMGLAVDGSYSMKQGSPSRSTWARALALTLLNQARREKRDFFMVEFASGGETAEWTFPAREPLDPQKIVDMASHFFGGGTEPLDGVKRAAELIQTWPDFKKADLILISDGEAGFGDEDKRMRELLVGRGMRIHGVAIGEGQGYLSEMCTEPVVKIHDFELADPNEATTQLATSIT
jgi:uncharacterized protein with von Willebrand factor type A (vWA) domain